MDIQPVNEGHVLVVPMRHAAYLTDLTADECAHVMRVAQRIAGGAQGERPSLRGDQPVAG
jgi:diadenosine tetraphosphate (Ap4A) HIT family hydrolase